MRSGIAATLIATAVFASCLGASRGLADALSDGKAAWEKGNFQDSMSLLRPLAEAGNAEAQFWVGVLHTNGQGVEENRAEAVKWFLLAADQGSADAQYSLGQEYALGGPGVPRDPLEAYFWLVLAVEGYTEVGRSAKDSAIQMRDLMAGKLTPEQIALADERLAKWKATH